MLRQITQARRDRKVRIAHDGADLRLYRDNVVLDRARSPVNFEPVRWAGEPRVALPQLGGELRFRKARGAGFDESRMNGEVTIRVRSGGERLQPDPRRPRRTLKNLFQEAGVPPWERERLPLLYCGTQLVWVPGNHELWTVPRATGRRGVARYEELVALCRRRGVLTPEDPFPVWAGEGGPPARSPRGPRAR